MFFDHFHSEVQDENGICYGIIGWLDVYYGLRVFITVRSWQTIRRERRFSNNKR